TRSFVGILWFVAERIRDPPRSVVASLEFDLVSRGRHHRKQSVRVGDSEWREQSMRQRENGTRSSYEKRNDRRVERDAKDCRLHSPIDPESRRKLARNRLRDWKPDSR